MKLLVNLFIVAIVAANEILAEPGGRDSDYSTPPRLPPTGWNTWNRPTPAPPTTYHIPPTPVDYPSYPHPIDPPIFQPPFHCPGTGYGTWIHALPNHFCGKLYHGQPYYHRCPTGFHCIKGHCCPIVSFHPPIYS